MKIIISELQLKKIKNLLLEEGEAVSIINNGQKLSGKCVKGDCKNGIGNATFSDGSKYSGNWVGGNRTYGKFFDKSVAETLTGTWSGGLKNGNFTVVYRYGTKGFGKYVNNKKQGKWEYKWADGSPSVETYNNGKLTYQSDYKGNKTSTDAAGNTYDVDANGNKTYTDASGKQYTVDANGTKTSIDAAGNTYQVDGDGIKTSTDAAGNTYRVVDLGNGEKRYNSYNVTTDNPYDYAIEKKIKSGGGFEYYSGNLNKEYELNGNGKVCKSLDETTMVLAGCVSATFLNGKRVYKDTNASGLNKCSRYADCSTKTTNDKYFKCDSCEKIGTLQACLKIKNPNLIADKKWGPNTESALNKLGYSSVSGITDTDITKICGGTSETMPVSERDLRRLVRRIVNEGMFENSLYSDIMDVIKNSNSSHEETVSILRNIVDEMTLSRKVRRGAESRFRDDV